MRFSDDWLEMISIVNDDFSIKKGHAISFSISYDRIGIFKEQAKIKLQIPIHMYRYSMIERPLYIVRIGKVSDKYENIKEDRYRRFVFTLQQCGKFLVDASDETIETCIFENFDIGIRGDICDENLELFIYEGWINEEIKDKCLKLQSLFFHIHNKQPQIWNIQSVRISRTWRDVLELSDEIRSLLYY